MSVIAFPQPAGVSPVTTHGEQPARSGQVQRAGRLQPEHEEPDDGRDFIDAITPLNALLTGLAWVLILGGPIAAWMVFG